MWGHFCCLQNTTVVTQTKKKNNVIFLFHLLIIEANMKGADLGECLKPFVCQVNLI